MNNVTIKKSVLLEKLKSNRAAHIEKYDKAMVGYKIAAHTAYVNALKNLKENGKVTSTFMELQEPEQHIKEYDTVLLMLEFSTDGSFELTRQQFQSYIQDDWSWTSSFKLETAGYIGIGTTAPEELLHIYG
jgi:hypothetical protein